MKSSTSGSGSGSGTYATGAALAAFGFFCFGGGMSFAGGSCARLRSSNSSTTIAKSFTGTHAYPLGPLAAMFGVRRISSRSSCVCTGLVGGHAPEGWRGLGRRPGAGVAAGAGASSGAASGAAGEAGPAPP